MKIWQYCLVGGFLALGLTACGGSDGGKGGGSSTPQAQTPGGGANPAGNPGGVIGGGAGGGFGGGGFGGGTQGGFGGGGFGGGTQGGNPGGGTQGGNPGGGGYNPGGGTQGGNPGGGTQGGNPGGGTQGGNPGGGTQGGNPGGGAAADPSDAAAAEAFGVIENYSDQIEATLHNYTALAMMYRCHIKQNQRIMGEPRGTFTVQQNGQIVGAQIGQPNDRLRIKNGAATLDLFFTRVQSGVCSNEYDQQAHDIAVRVASVDTGRYIDIRERMDAQFVKQKDYRGHFAIFDNRVDYEIDTTYGNSAQNKERQVQSGTLQSPRFTVTYQQAKATYPDPNAQNELTVVKLVASSVQAGQAQYSWKDVVWGFNVGFQNQQMYWVDGKFSASGQVLKNNQPWGTYGKSNYAAGSGNLAQIYVDTPVGRNVITTMNPRPVGGQCTAHVDCQSNNCDANNHQCMAPAQQ